MSIWFTKISGRFRCSKKVIFNKKKLCNCNKQKPQNRRSKLKKKYIYFGFYKLLNFEKVNEQSCQKRILIALPYQKLQRIPKLNAIATTKIVSK